MTLARPHLGPSITYAEARVGEQVRVVRCCGEADVRGRLEEVVAGQRTWLVLAQGAGLLQHREHVELRDVACLYVWPDDLRGCAKAD